MRQLFFIISFLVLGFASAKALKFGVAYACSCNLFDYEKWTLKLVSVKSSDAKSELINDETAFWTHHVTVRKDLDEETGEPVGLRINLATYTDDEDPDGE